MLVDSNLYHSHVIKKKKFRMLIKDSALRTFKPVASENEPKCSRLSTTLCFSPSHTFHTHLLSALFPCKTYDFE